MKFLKAFERYEFISNSSINKSNIIGVQGLSDLTINQELFMVIQDVEYNGKMVLDDFIQSLSIIYDGVISSPNSTNIVGVALKTSDAKLSKLLNSDSMKVLYKGYYIFKLSS